MDVVRLLPDSVANQIAAGEVIQRPASVIKELVENAVDAGARQIDVFVIDAGRTSIQVIDDGKGMSETDARLALERHATSKIRCAEDLFTLRTMGFRGEALPSIVAVSQVTIKTRSADTDLGTQLEVEGSKVLSQEICSCPIGTNFEVRNIFFNIPARRKFLKSNQTELSNIIQEFQRIALVNTSVEFSLSSNGNTLVHLLSSTRKGRILDIFGKSLGGQLVEVSVETSIVKIDGFVGRPESSRKKGLHQYFFVNGRYMRHAYFHKAVMDAFDQLIPAGEQIPYFLYFEIDPAAIDVNISPTKTEIKFENEPAIWQVISAGIRESLGRFQAVKTFDFDVEGNVDIPVCAAPNRQDSPRYNSSPLANKSSVKDWQQLYADLTATVPQSQQQPSLFPVDPVSAPDKIDIGDQFLQYGGQYIVFTSSTGLMIVNQCRAHVRVLYDRYRRMQRQNAAPSQGLLFPEILELPPSDAQMMESMEDSLHSMGFDIVSLGGGTYSINGLPPGTEGLQPQKLLQDMIATAYDKGSGEPLESMHHKLALSLARNVSIVPGQVLSQDEMSALIRELFETQNPNYTPDGQLILHNLDVDNVAKMFV